MKTIVASGAHIPSIGLGTYRLQGDSCATIVARAIEVGYRHIDTARMYENEREVGQGIRTSGVDRDDLFITTKIWHDSIGTTTLVDSAREAIEALGIGPVDLLLIHWPNAEIALEDSIGALNSAKAEGLTHHIGVANFTSAMLDDATAISDAPLVCNQVEYHPFLSQDAIMGACERHDMALVAYSPIGQGRDLLNHPTIQGVAQAHGRTPAQIVLRWEIEQARVAAIPRTSNPDRLLENLDVFSFELTPEEHRSVTALTTRRERLVDPSFAPNWDRI